MLNEPFGLRLCATASSTRLIIVCNYLEIDADTDGLSDASNSADEGASKRPRITPSTSKTSSAVSGSHVYATINPHFCLLCSKR